MMVDAVLDGAGLTSTLCTGLAVENGSRLCSKLAIAGLDCQVRAALRVVKRHTTVGAVPEGSRCTSVPRKSLALAALVPRSPTSREKSPALSAWIAYWTTNELLPVPSGDATGSCCQGGCP